MRSGWGNRRKEMVDLVGLEPTTSSMPCCSRGSRTLVFKNLRTGILGGNGMFGAISGQFPAKEFNERRRAAWAGVHAGRLNVKAKFDNAVGASACWATA